MKKNKSFKEANKKGILICMANANGWRNPNICGGAELITISGISEIKEFEWHVLLSEQLYNIFKDKYCASHLRYYPLKAPFVRTGILKDLLQGIIFTAKYVILGWRLRNKYNLIYSCTTNFSDIFPTKIISIITKKPYITKYHISVYEEPKITPIYKNFRNEKNGVIDSFVRALLAWLTIGFLKKAKLNIVVSKYLGAQIIKCGIDKNIVRLNYNGINYEKLENYRVTNIEKEYDLCFMGRVEKNKGLLDIVMVTKAIKKIRPNISLVIIGDGTYLPDIKKIVQEENLDANIFTTGFLNEERYAYLQKSKIFISPTYAMEGFGLSLLESSFFGVPVIAYQNEVFEEIFDGCDLVHLIPRNLVSFKNKILELINVEQVYQSHRVTKYSMESFAERERFLISQIINE